MSENKPIVAISSDFLTAYSKLPKPIQAKTAEFINKFRANPLLPGLNLEKIDDAQDDKILSARINDAYRAIIARDSETNVYLILWADHHDEAYAWARRKRVDVNKKTGSIQVFDIQTEVVKEEKQGIFSQFSNEQLLFLSVPPEQLDFVRGILDLDDFVSKKDSFSNDTYEALEWLANGFTYDEVVELVESEKADAQSFAEALQNSKTKESFVVVEGEEELSKMLAEPLEKWRVFLHSSQRALVCKDFSGSYRVTGSAGTGKTVVAMHRAKYLSKRCRADQNVLFTTFTSNLSGDIRESLRKVCDVDELRHIEISNLDAWVSSYLRGVGIDYTIVYDGIEKYWERALIESGLDTDLPADFYKEEYESIALAQESLSKEDYMKASRLGKGIRLDRLKRLIAWQVFEQYQRIICDEHVRDSETAVYEARILIEKDRNFKPYASVIVDEGQDFSLNAYRLIRALAGKPHVNDLFIVGDAHQRIYGKKPVLSKSGIDVRGRSRVLRINYRTTEETRRYAFALLEGIPFDNLDGEYETGDKCESLTHGDDPCIKVFEDGNAEFDFVVSEIKSLEGLGVDLKDICLVARTHKYVDDYMKRLAAVGIRLYEIKRSKIDDRTMPGLRIATMHRVKGLEFQYLFVVDCNDRVVPLASAINVADSGAKKEAEIAERCLLYVALTRAQKKAYVLAAGKPSEYISKTES